MIKLIVDDFDQVTMLESLLNRAGIEYVIEGQTREYGILPPYLVVDGAPLDYSRSIRYILQKLL